MQLLCESVCDRFRLACGNLHAIPLRREIADDDGRIRCTRLIHEGQQRASDNGKGHCAGLVVGDIENGAGWVAVDELDAKDLGLWEGSFYVDGEGGCLELGLIAYFAANLLNIFDLNASLAPS